MQKLEKDFEARVARAVDAKVYEKIKEVTASIEAEAATKTEETEDEESEAESEEDKTSHSRYYRSLTVRAIGRLRRIATAKNLERHESLRLRAQQESREQEEALERDRDPSNLSQHERRRYIRKLGDNSRKSVEVLRELEKDILAVQLPNYTPDML